jgi:Asp-tRNA(Asn)/Glu-tRNA(Gln) amidotransferase A subunit family amidase
VRGAFDVAIARLRKAGVAIAPRTIDGTAEIIDTYVNISLADAAHWHANVLGTLDSRASDYQPAVRERLERGRGVLAVSYLRAMSSREALRVAVDSALAGCEALVLPTLPIVAPPLGATDVAMDSPAGDRLLVRAAMLRLTQLFNMTGHPAISIPIPVSGMPVGLQLVGARDATAKLLAIAQTCERELA